NAIADARVARTEAGLQAGLEVLLAARNRALHAGAAIGPGGSQAPGGVRAAGFAAQPEHRGERDRERGADGAAEWHDQDLLLAQSLLVSSWGLMLPFASFWPAAPCHTSTS